MSVPARDASEMTTIDLPTPAPERTEVVRTMFDDSLRTMMIDPTGERSAELRAIEKELAVFLGPLARVVVKRAAAKTTDSDELWRILAKSLERESDRDAFLARRDAFHRKGHKPAAPPPLPAAPLTTAINPASALGITPEAIDHAARALATHVGPISGVLAKKAAQRADSLRSFYVLLSEHVRNGKDRRRFLRDAGFPDA
jgi:serine/threonine-protein kinase